MGIITQHPRFSEILHVGLSDEQLEMCRDLGGLCSGALTSKGSASDPHDKVAPEISDFLIQFGSWVESFSNSQTMRDGGTQLEAFDIEMLGRMPQFNIRD